MNGKAAVPDAWDDDWVNAADKADATATEVAPRLTKSQRKAQHQELQKQLWDSAENPSRNHWLETQGVVPLKQEFKPQLTLLSRKPTPSTTRKANGVGNADVEDEGDDSEEEARKKRELDFEERQRRAKSDREEKQRKYAEARERIMGSSSSHTPATATTSRESSQGRDNRKPRPRVNSARPSRPTSANHSPTPAGSDSGQLFDPEDTGRRPLKASTSTLDGPSRQPKGPERQGRGGFGFAGRGGAAGV